MSTVTQPISWRPAFSTVPPNAAASTCAPKQIPSTGTPAASARRSQASSSSIQARASPSSYTEQVDPSMTMCATPRRSGSGPSLGNRIVLSCAPRASKAAPMNPAESSSWWRTDDDLHAVPPIAGDLVWCQTTFHDASRRPDRPRHVGARGALRRVRPAPARRARRLARRGAAELGFLVRLRLLRHCRCQPGRGNVLLRARYLLRGADRRGHGGPADDHRHRPARAHQAPQDRVRRLLGPGGRGLPALRRGPHRAGT